MIDEYRQTFVPGRHGSRIDVLIDMVGVVMAVFFIGLSFLITRWGLPQGTKVSSTKD